MIGKPDVAWWLLLLGGAYLLGRIGLGLLEKL